MSHTTLTKPIGLLCGTGNIIFSQQHIFCLIFGKIQICYTFQNCTFGARTPDWPFLPKSVLNYQEPGDGHDILTKLINSINETLLIITFSSTKYVFFHDFFWSLASVLFFSSGFAEWTWFQNQILIVWCINYWYLPEG